jgi:hypothetical protein
MKISVRFYRIYDIGNDIDLGRLEESLARSYFTTRAGFLRIKPKSIMLEDPPLQLRMEPVQISRDGQIYDMSVIARIYDIGVISLCFVYEDPSADPMTLNVVGTVFAEQEGLDSYFEYHLKTIQTILSPHLSNMVVEPGFFEDYTIFVTDRMDVPEDPAPLLIGESAPLSAQMRDETLRHSLSYSTDDRVILSWDSSLICSPEHPADLLDLIEYANVQVFELRHYDRQLVLLMERMYDDIEDAERQSRFRRMRRYHTLMNQIMERYADISETIEKVNNLIKVTEDVYYAKVYATALTVFRSGQWSESVTRKIEVIRENYSMLSDEVRIQHSYFLEWVIIVLIALEFGLAIIEYLGV